MEAEEDPTKPQEELAFINVEPETSNSTSTEDTTSTAAATGAKTSDKEALYVANDGDEGVLCV